MKLIQSVKRRIVSDDRKQANPSTPSPQASTSPATGTTGTLMNATGSLLSKGGLASSQMSMGSLSGKSLVKSGTKSALDSNPFQGLPLLKDTPVSDRQELFKRKLMACSVVYDFNNPQSHVKEKDQKRATLLEIIEYVNASRNCFAEPVLEHVVGMVTVNVFRALPPPHSGASSRLMGGMAGGSPGAIFEAEEEEPSLEPSWPHLQVVYELFLRFIVSNDVDPRVARKYIDQPFVLKLLELFDSEDPRERDYLKTILHRIYGKLMALRSFIRKSIQNLFFKIIYECEQHNGIAELLEILGSIINGFALPLKDEHKQFLEKSLIPLHKVKNLSAFHQQLSYCMSQYVEKDPRVAEPIIFGLLRYWPVTSTSKEVLFLNELEEILELTQPLEFARIEPALFRRIIACITSPHFQVAERALFLWNNEYVLKLIVNHRTDLFPKLVPVLYANSKAHWNQTVHGLTYNVLKLMMEADPVLFDECSKGLLPASAATPAPTVAVEETTTTSKENDDRAEAERKWAILRARFQQASTA